MPAAYPTTGSTPWQTTLKSYIDDRAVAANLTVNVKSTPYSATGNGVTDDTTAVTAAIAAAKAAGATVYFPAGTYKITGDLTLDYHFASIIGDGGDSLINFTNGGFIVDGSSALVSRTLLRDLRISRSGTAGPVVYLKGGSGSVGVVRFTIDNIDIQGSTGDGLEISGCYIGTILGSYFRVCTGRGVYLHAPAAFPTISSNAISFHGGEIQQNAAGGVELNRATNVAFFGTTIEGNVGFGAKLNNCYSVGFYTPYFEANGTDDILLGDVTTNHGVVIENGFFLESGTSNAGGVAKTRSIRMLRADGVRTYGNTFLQYAANSPININEASTGAVIATVSEAENYSDGSATIVNVVAGTKVQGVWQNFTPTWGATTTNPVLNNGTFTGRYRKSDRMVDVEYVLTIGSTTTFGTGSWVFSLPSGVVLPNLRFGKQLGEALGSGGSFAIVAGAQSTTQVQLMTFAAAANAAMVGVTGTVPFTPAAGNVYTLQIRVEATTD